MSPLRITKFDLWLRRCEKIDKTAMIHSMRMNLHPREWWGRNPLQGPARHIWYRRFVSSTRFEMRNRRRQRLHRPKRLYCKTVLLRKYYRKCGISIQHFSTPNLGCLLYKPFEYECIRLALLVTESHRCVVPRINAPKPWIALFRYTTCNHSV